MKTLSLPSIFKTTAVLLLFTLFGFQQQATAQLNVQNNTGCFVLVGAHFGNGCNLCNNTTNGVWVPPGFSQIPIPNCLVAAVPPARWIMVKYAIAPFPSPFLAGATSISFNPFGGLCGFTQNNSNCNGPHVAFWTGPNNITFQ